MREEKCECKASAACYGAKRVEQQAKCHGEKAAVTGCEVWHEVTVGRLQVIGLLLTTLSLSWSVCLPAS